MEQKIALVFAGGGSLGANQVGMLRALVEYGITPDLLVGSSVGAVNAAYFAGHPDIEGVEELAGIWRSLQRDEVFRFSLFGGIRGLLGRSSHLFDAGAFAAFLKRHLTYNSFSEARIPLYIIAGDFISGEEVLLAEGPVLRALQASTAIPGVFPPVEVDGLFLIDGGVANHTPISTAVDLGATRVIVLPTGFTCAPVGLPQGAMEVALHALNLIIARQLYRDLQTYSVKAKVALIPPLCPQKTNPFDFAQVEQLMTQAYESTRQWLAVDGLDREDDYTGMMPHRHAVM